MWPYRPAARDLCPAGPLSHAVWKCRSTPIRPWRDCCIGRATGRSVPIWPMRSPFPAGSVTKKAWRSRTPVTRSRRTPSSSRLARFWVSRRSCWRARARGAAAAESTASTRSTPRETPFRFPPTARLPMPTRVPCASGSRPTLLGLIDRYVEVHEGTAASVAAGWAIPIDMLFLDGDQSPDGARLAYDVWAPFLKIGGIIALHNSTQRKYAPGHDGHHLLAVHVVRPPQYATSAASTPRRSHAGRRDHARRCVANPPLPKS